jgi:hypothetical protein
MDDTTHYVCIASAIHEPQNINKALVNVNWKNAMDSEFSVLMRNRTWQLVSSQQGRNIIDFK